MHRERDLHDTTIPEYAQREFYEMGRSKPSAPTTNMSMEVLICPNLTGRFLTHSRGLETPLTLHVAGSSTSRQARRGSSTLLRFMVKTVGPPVPKSHSDSDFYSSEMYLSPRRPCRITTHSSTSESLDSQSRTVCRLTACVRGLLLVCSLADGIRFPASCQRLWQG
jgi:hypothetical protein